MKISGNTILITGEGTGIGLAMVEEFSRAGNRVIICGRREDRLEEAKKRFPGLHTKAVDITKASGREVLYTWVSENFKETNILINNAGVCKTIDLKDGPILDLSEIETNLVAPVSLAALFIPLLLGNKEAAIMNVTSGLAFLPTASEPLYCATKAAIHSFTMSLRHQLKDTSIKVFEIIPPVVATEMGAMFTERGGQMHDQAEGSQVGQTLADEQGSIPILLPAEIAREVMKALRENQFELAIGIAKDIQLGARNNPEELFRYMNQ